MAKITFNAKDPDCCQAVAHASGKTEREREAFSDKYFEFGEYCRFEIDTKTMQVRLVPVEEWQ